MAVVEGKAKVTVDGATAGQQLEKLEQKARDIRSEIVKLRKEPLVDQQKVKTLETALKKVTTETKQARASTIDYRKTLQNLSGASLKELQTAYRKLNLETSKLDRTTKLYKKNAGNLAKIKNEISKVKREMTGAGTAAKGFGANMKNIASQMFAGGGVLAAVFALVSIIKGAFNIMLDFGKASSKLQAIMGKTKDEMALLTQQAKDLGSTSAFTATEVLELQTELAKLGFTEQQILQSTEAILDLAAATGTELAASAELAGSTLRIFNLEASEMNRVTDVLAKSTTISSLSMEKLATILPTVGKTAQIAGVSLEKTAALAGTLTDRGLDASAAATSLRNIFLELSKKGLTWDEAMKKINASSDKNKTSMDLFGKRAAAAGVILSETGASVDELTASLEDADGAAQEMADTMLDNLSGDITIAKSAWEGFILSMADGEGVFSQVLRNAVSGFTELLNVITKMNDGQSFWAIKAKRDSKFTEKLTTDIDLYKDKLKELETEEEKGAFVKAKILEISSLQRKNNRDLITGTEKLAEAKRNSNILNRRGTVVAEQELTQLELNRDFFKEKIVLLEKLKPVEKTRVDILADLANEANKLAAAEEKGAKATAKATKERLKANQQLQDQINKMNVDLIADEKTRAEAELNLWLEKETAKIEISKASTELKNEAVEVLEQTHKDKLLEIDSKYFDDVLAQFESVNAFLESENQRLEADKQIILDNELLAISAKYDAQIAIVQENMDKELGLKSELDAQLIELELLKDEALRIHKEETLLAEEEAFEEAKFNIRNFYGFVKIKEAREKEIEEIKKAVADKLLTEKEGAEAIFNVKLKFAREFAAKSQVITSTLGNFFSAAKEAELAAAGDNEEKKLQIMKKFADKEFAVKAAQIVANTAVAILTALAQLGPVAGGIASGFITATGLLQLSNANAERKRVKGLAEGGEFPVTRQQDGRKFNAVNGGQKRGFIKRPTVLVGEDNKREFVVSNKSLQNADIKRTVSAIDSFQKGGGLKYFDYNKVISSGSTIKGFQDGGFTETEAATEAVEDNTGTTAALAALLLSFNNFATEITEWQSTLKTEVVYQDIEDAGEEINTLKTDVTV